MTLLEQAKVANEKIKFIKTENATLVQEIEELKETEQNFEQLLKDTRDGLAPVPKNGEPWKVNLAYTTTMTCTHTGSTWEALKFTRGNEPGSSPNHWKVKEVEKYPLWTSFSDGTVIYGKDSDDKPAQIVEDQGYIWICLVQHFKSTMYRPKDGSTRWEKMGSA